MKKCKHFIFFVACFITGVVYAQNPIDEEKVKKAVVLMQKMMTDPGQMQTVMTELQALKLNSAENKEAQTRMQNTAIKQAGEIKKQVTATGGITEKQITEFKENKDRIVPLKDAERINAVLKRDLSDAEINKFCQALHEAVKKEMNPAAVSQAEKIYITLKAKYPAAEMGNAAISCYLANLTQQSIYILGKVCIEDPKDANNLNNYAVLLTNHGVEQGAIPLLNYLNRKFAKSPVVMSNLSLAWLGLGDLKTAEKYADSCIRFFPGNASHAHYAKAIVKEGEGNRQGAIEELKLSLADSYSAEKESLLKKMGGKMKSSDFKKKLPADALGLSKFHFPGFPKSYEAALNSTVEWEIYYKNIKSSIADLEIKTERLRKEYESKTTTDVKEAINFTAQNNGKPSYAFSANNNTNQSWSKFYQLLSDEFTKKEEEMMKEARRLTDKNSKMLDDLDTIVKVQLAKRFEQDAAGQKFTEAEACMAYKTAYDNYMEPANNMFENFHLAYMNHKRKMTNELVYAGKQFMDKEYYEFYASSMKLQFLYSLEMVSYEIPSYALGLPYAEACINVKQKSNANNGLADWNDVNCNNNWEANLGVSTVSTNCSKITLKFDVLIAEGSFSQDLFTGEWTNMSLEIGRGIGSKTITDKLGMEIGGVGVEVGAFIEIDRTGISDFGVKGKAGLEGGRLSLAGAEGRISIKSGKASFEVKSDLSKAAVSYK
jgi:tetratricopeptide (TPR) repeat protein